VLLSTRSAVESLVAQVCKAFFNISAHKIVQIHIFRSPFRLLSHAAGELGKEMFLGQSKQVAYHQCGHHKIKKIEI